MRFVKTTGLVVLAFIYLNLMITMADVAYDRMHLFYFGNAAFATEAVYQIPGTYEEIVLERRAAHLFLAEYNRELVFRIGDREFSRTAAAADSGGYSKMKVFQISPRFYFLCGELSNDAYIIDSWVRSTRDVEFDENFPKATYIGVFDKDEKGPWRFIAANERAEEKDKLTGSGCSRHIEDIHIWVAGLQH